MSNITLDFLTSKKEKTPGIVEEPSNEESTTAASSSSAPPSQSSSPPQILNLLNAITDIILNEKNIYPDEIRSNACMFLEKASKASSGHRKYSSKFFLSFFFNPINPLQDIKF